MTTAKGTESVTVDLMNPTSVGVQTERETKKSMCMALTVIDGVTDGVTDGVIGGVTGSLDVPITFLPSQGIDCIARVT